MPDNNPSLQYQQVLNRRIEAFRKVFLTDGEMSKDQHIVMETLEICAKTRDTSQGGTELKVLLTAGRQELLNWIHFYLNYDQEDRRKLAESIEQTEDALREQKEI